MRIYYQIPIAGTEDEGLDVLAQLVVPSRVCGELEVFRQLMRCHCTAAPRLCGYAETTQDGHDLVPGGFIRYLVREKVPGEPLTEEFFWSLDLPARDTIRAKFRAAYE